MKKTLLTLIYLSMFLVILFASLSLTSGAVCGNGICEKGERESICPACVYQNPGCEQPCQVRAICEQDCGEQTCTDSDNGLNYYVKGNVDPHCAAPCGVWIDTCKDEETLIEYYCKYDDEKKEYDLNKNFVEYKCPGKCEDGKCKIGECSIDSDCPKSTVLTRCPSGCLYSKYYECQSGKCIEKIGDLEAPCNPEANCGIFKSSDDIARCGNGICEQGEANSFYSIPCADAEGCPSPYITKEGTCPGDCGNKNIEIKFNEQLSSIEKNKTNTIKLSNGKNAEIKIMPSTASARAIERLSLKVCSVENNCTIVLKETGQGNDIKAVYEFKVKKNYRILALFKAKAENKVEVDAETGETIVVKKPWWAFLAVSVD